MKELLGFIVLTGPLFFIVLWIFIGLPLAILAGSKFAKEERNKKKKIFKGLVIATGIFCCRLRMR